MLKNKIVHIIIMAGGSGKRLWPLSRSGKPKQFIKLGSEKTLLEETVERMKNIFENQKISVVTSKNFENLVDRLVGNSIDQIIVEPEAKNTAPAILYSCLNLQANPKDVVIFLPSDHHIPDFHKFRESIKQAAYAANETENIVLVGIKPTHPATGYGYISINNQETPDPSIQRSSIVTQGERVFNYRETRNKNYFEVQKFHEKPNITLAQKYFNSGNMLWNSGIICAKLSVLLDSFEKQFPEVKELSGSKIYNIIPEISFDCAILEKIKNVSVVVGDFSWSDVGTLDVFIAAKKDIQNKENLVSIESENNLVEVQNKLVVLVGINDLCIVETDDVLLISTKKDIDKVKDVISELNSSGKKEYC